MDFMKLLKSLEELLYEVMVMLVFYPKTLWLTFRYPQRMMDYADTELGDVQSEQYNDTLSPPLFLMICLAISHMIEITTLGNSATAALPAFLKTTENLLAFRVLVFSLFPLMMALRLLYGLNEPLNRETLRAPFYAQCFVTAPLAMAFGISQSLRHTTIPYADQAATVLTVVALAWYIRQQAHWFKAKLNVSTLRSWVMSALIFVLTIILLIMAAAPLILST
ncbi:MAG: hypothetical protein ACK4SJ_07735 [Sphingorhabdus sp.]